MKFRHACCLMLLCPFVTTVAHPIADATFQPIRYRNQNIIALQGLGLTPVGAPLPAGTTRTWLTNDYSSIFEYFQTTTHDVLVDLELWRIGAGIAHGFANGLTVRAEMPFFHSEGGFLDGFLNWYHRSLGFPNAGRELVANNGFGVHITDVATGTPIYEAASAGGIVPGDLHIQIQKQICSETVRRPAISWQGSVEIPTGRKRFGTSNGEIDIGMSIAVQKQWKRLTGFAEVGYYNSPPAPGLEPFVSADSVEAVLGLGVRVHRAIQIVTQLHGSTQKFYGLNHQFWDTYPLDLMIGVTGRHVPTRYRFQALTWQVGFSEDLNANGPSIDFTTHAQIGLEF